MSISTEVKIETKTVITTEADEVLAWLNLPTSSFGRLPDGTFWVCDLALPKQSIAFGQTITEAVQVCAENIKMFKEYESIRLKQELQKELDDLTIAMMNNFFLSL